MSINTLHKGDDDDDDDDDDNANNGLLSLNPGVNNQNYYYYYYYYYLLSPLCRVFTIICVKQTVLLGYVLLRFFCIYSLLISLLILYTDMETSS